MLFFRRGKALRTIEDGLRWKAAESQCMQGRTRLKPEGVFVTVPAIEGLDQLDGYLEALQAESDYVLDGAKPLWVQLRGPGLASLPMDRVRAVAQAACPSSRSAGLEINPEALEPGTLAGYRSIAMERLCFAVDTPFSSIDDPVRKARALGAYTSVEVCLNAGLSGKAFQTVVERALAAAPDQLCVSDARSHGAFGSELLEKAGELCVSLGMLRTSAWTWSRDGNSFDSLGILLSGRVANLGPDAVTCRPAAYMNPERRRWLETRLSGNFEVIQADGRQEQWLALAAGLYALELRRDCLDCRMHRHVSSLERMGVIDRKGRPANAQAMEFFHRASRAARQAALGASQVEWMLDDARGSEMATVHANARG